MNALDVIEIVTRKTMLEINDDAIDESILDQLEPLASGF